MSNYGAIPPSTHMSTSPYQGPSTPRASRTSLSRSSSRSQSQPNSLEDAEKMERNSKGVEGARNVRFASLQGRGGASGLRLGDDSTVDRQHTDEVNSVGDPAPHDPPAHDEHEINGVGNGKRKAGDKDILGELRKKLWQPSLVLVNSGSVARDHLASERTFLAYVRTSLAIASAGVALVQLFSISTTASNGIELNSHLQKFARPLGSLMECMGILLLLVGGIRYFRVQKALIAGKFPIARKTIIFVSSVLAIFVAVLFGILVAVPRR